MEIVEQEEVNVANSVLVSGLTETETDTELTDYLEQHGYIARVLRIDNPTSAFHKNAIVEFKSSLALSTLKPLLPYTYRSSRQKDVSYKITALASVYMPSATKTDANWFLAEFQKLAAQSRKPLTELLQEQLLLCRETMTCQEDNQTGRIQDSSSSWEAEPTNQVSSAYPQSPTNAQSFPAINSERRSEHNVVLTPEELNPPAIQRVVVEHVVRSGETAAHANAPVRLRVFSGKKPHPNNEVDYETWRNNVELLLQDPAVSDLCRSRRVLDSLLPPAANLVKHLSPQATPRAYLDLLDSAFATVEDGDELFARFLNTLQDAGEKPSEYLQRLYIVLSKVIKQGSLPTSEKNRHLLRQFCRGCWDNGLLADLQLEQKKNNPPSFSELLFHLRMEEDKHIAKEMRMKKHLGNAKFRASSHAVRAETYVSQEEETLSAEVDSLRKQVKDLQGQLKVSKPKCPEYSEGAILELRQQVAHLQSQVANMMVPEPQKPIAVLSEMRNKKRDRTVTQETQTSATKESSQRPRPWYCFCCGEDGHTAVSCPADPNPSLVAAKKKQLIEKQHAWDREHSTVNQTISQRTKNPNVTRASVNNQTTQTKTYGNLPRGLVGTKCISEVVIDGQKYNCLLDTGSQVTTVSKSFHETHQPALSCKPIGDLLEVEAANGQPVPYSGYVELNITFPKEFLGTAVEVPTLALVVADISEAARPTLLIGTNTLDVLYEKHFEKNQLKHQSPHHGYKMVLKTLEMRHKQTENCTVGTVRLHSNAPKIIPAGQCSILEGSVNHRGADRWVVLESPSTASLPGGLIVTNSLISLPDKFHAKLPVVLRNETDHDITLTPNRVLAELHALQQILPSDALNKNSIDTSPMTASAIDASIKFDFADSPVPAEWRERIECKLRAMPEVFAHHDLDFGHTNQVKHRIKLSDETPFKQRARPIHPQDFDAVKRHLEELLESGVIRESESSFSSPIVVVRKKNGEVRLCVDYRKLNLQTVKDAYALPHLEETFSVLTGSKWFSVLDLKSGYYQIELEEADKHKTAFVCPLGFWEWNRMPQGITNAPSTFQRLMEKCMSDLNLREVIVFLDDLIIFSETLEEHEERLFKVLQRLKEYGLKLSPEKCKFFQKSVRYLGHIVSSDGVKTDPEKIAVLKNWPSPKNLKELRSFLGFAGYYRRFIRDFSKIVKPLNELTAGYAPKRKGCKLTKSQNQYYKPKELFGDRWTENCQEAFDTVIAKLTSAPVLGFANPSLPYILHTDASTIGLGAALYQEQDGHQRVIAYASRGLSKSEARYPAHKLEFLALKWAVTDKFSDYLYGNSFTVITDSNPLTYILTSAKLDAASYRWLSALSTFSFKLQYRPGKHNLDADALSRHPMNTKIDDPSSQKEQDRIRQFTLQHLPELTTNAEVSTEVVQAICEARLVCQPSLSASEVEPIPLVGSLSTHPDSLPDAFVLGEHFEGFPVIPMITEVELQQKQRSDPVIREVISSFERGEVPTPSARREMPKLSLMCREWNRLQMKDGILYRRRQLGQDVNFQLVLPEELREMVMKSLHDDMGHLGLERTLDLLRARFYWPQMASDVERKLKTCSRCVLRKAPAERAAPLVNIKATRPLELVCMDFLSLEPDRSNTKDILVITDYFTKYAVAIPTPNQKARTVAKCLWENFIIHYGVPEKLHSDQGPDFESKTIKELCEVMGIHKVRTTPYHPRGNPVERFNRTLLSMIGTLQEKEKSCWRDFVKPLVHAYNCTKHDSTGFIPYELMFGRKPRLPIDLAFNISVNKQHEKTHSQYVSHLRNQLEESYRLATENAAKSAERNKARFDKRVTESTLEKGDRVLVRNVKLRGKHKLSDKWESVVYVVVGRAGELPVYTVKPENKAGPLRTLHRDLLRPCNFLSPEEADLPISKVRRPRTRQMSPKENSEESDSNSDSDDYPIYYSSVPLRLEPVEIVQIHEDERIPVDSNFRIQLEPAVKNPSAEPEIPERENLPEKIPVKENLPERLAENEYLPTDHVDDPALNSEMLHSATPAEEVPENAEHLQPSTEESEDEETPASVRRSTRHREKAKRLTYPELGNPLISIVQSLFQGMTTALTQSLIEAASMEYANPAVRHPTSPMHRDVHAVKDGRV
ncbi:uncharacterized protein LOC111196705 [Astyanax mexicanus]|uniref:uncharacterized protein LOC111196705 n=1 Tax=Astyanax mexicanus TaxID=7994 RepID=UPI0020CAAB7A|nr:uncharacterized protein LOC111196705 [Astyanax mexicanus]